jgi:hypothetical protein
MSDNSLYSIYSKIYLNIINLKKADKYLFISIFFSLCVKVKLIIFISNKNKKHVVYIIFFFLYIFKLIYNILYKIYYIITLMSKILINLTSNNVIIDFHKNKYYYLKANLYKSKQTRDIIDLNDVECFNKNLDDSNASMKEDIETFGDFIYFSNMNQSYESNVDLLDSFEVLEEKYNLKEFTYNDYQFMLEKLMRLIDENKDVYDYIDEYNDNRYMYNESSDILHTCKKSVLLLEVPRKEELWIENYLFKDINLTMFSTNGKTIIIKKKEHIKYCPSYECVTYNKNMRMTYNVDEDCSVIYQVL